MENEDPTYEELARPLTVLFDQLGPKTQRFVIQCMRLLSEGRPLSPELIAAALGMSRDDVKTVLSQLGSGAEVNEEGEVVAIMGLSLNPTVHRLQVAGKELFSWCASDAISLAAIIQKPVRVESPDPVSGATIRLEVSPEGVVEIDPGSAVVSWVTGVDATDIRASFCNSVNFFASPETADRWRSNRPGLRILTVREVEKVDRVLVEPFRDMIEG
ncbi:MAG: alkylmercury lyase [Candidatus Thermoplasmatota archaeon]|nr:alkylmercury lyase [Candidatus Thermoplasmatota archaeon]